MEIARGVARRVVATRRVLRQQPLDHVNERRGRLPVEVGDRIRLLAHDRRHRVERVIAGEGRLAGGQLVENGAERKLIGAEIERPPVCLLGRHVADRADDRAGIGGRHLPMHRIRVVLGRRDQLGQTEVEDLHEAVLGDHHVFRLQVAMDDSLLVRRGEAVGDLRRDVQRPAVRRRPAAQQRPQVRSLDVLHDDVRRAAVGADFVDGHDVRMVERRRGARLAREARQTLAVAGETLREDLDGHGAAERRIARNVDLSHATRPERPDDPVRPERFARRAVHAK